MEYWVEKYRYQELRYFCLQYPTWKRAANRLLNDHLKVHSDDPVCEIASRRENYLSKMKLVETTCIKMDPKLWPWLLLAVSHGVRYERLDIPCSKEEFVQLYRKFFWTLDQDKGD